jgi:O-antigen/teichoic acid export membrane protein
VSLLRFLALLVGVNNSSIPIVPRLSSVNIRSLREIFGFASLSFIGDVASRYYFLADSILAARFLPLSDLAILSVCRRLPSGLTSLAHQPLWVAYPIVSSAWSRGDRKALQRYMSVSTRTLLVTVVPLSAAMFIWAEPILRYWIGPSILTGIPVFRALVVFGLFASFGEGALTLLYGVGRIGFSTALILVLLATLAMLGCWVVPHWGLLGLAALFASLYGIGVVLLYAKALRVAGLRLEHWLLKDVLPVLMPAAIAAVWFRIGYVILGPTLTGLVLSIITGFLIYAACLLAATTSGGTGSLRHRIKVFFWRMDEI